MDRSCSCGAGQASPQAHCAVLERFSKHRRWNTPISRDLMADAETREIGRKIANCALTIKADVILKPDQEPEANLTGARLCNTRFCPFCEARRTKALRARLYQGLDALYADKPKLKGVFLTLTVKNVPLEELGDQLDQMNKAWQRLKSCSFWPTDLWFRRTEVTVGTRTSGLGFLSSGRGGADQSLYAHPHFHCLLLVRPSYFSRDYIKKSEWQKQWQMALRADYAPVIDVRTAKTHSTSGSLPAIDAKAAVVEAAKYAAKATSLMEIGPAITTLHWQLRNRRMTAISKELAKYVKQGEFEHEELMDASSEPLPADAERLEVIGQWFDDVQEYVITHLIEEKTDPKGGGRVPS